MSGRDLLKSTASSIGLDTKQVFNPAKREKRLAKARSEKRKKDEELLGERQLEQAVSARASLVSGRSIGNTQVGVGSILGR